ncbi:MAG: replication-associated recombination protein A [Anaeroplasmataceae bacterium]
MEPLAYKTRPSEFSEIVGQDHLVGENGVIKKMIEKNKFFSIILYGTPGCGKTTIANVVASYFEPNVYSFNASTDNKEKLKDIANNTLYYDNTFVIIDEIHRMKKDTQDYLLPYLESNKITILGLTTENPYISINPAIRSRCHIYKLNPISESDIILILKNTIKKENLFLNNPIDDEILDFIASKCGCEVRTALNMLESLTLIDGKITLDNASNIIGQKAFKLDSKGNNYYDILSAFQKSIRGSDVNAALHYLARLIKLEDLEIIIRRLIVIAYEDIGLANPSVGPRVIAACDAAKRLGFPEARIPLSAITIDLALSPKSNSAEASIDKALADLEAISSYEIPPHILNSEIKRGANYKYPHDYPDDFVKQQYLPDTLFDKVYFTGKETGKYERALKERNEYLQSILKKR